MKKYLLIVTSFSLLQISFAQTAADYYTPLCPGNYVHIYTPGGTGPNSYGARNTYYKIVKADTINNVVHYLQKGYEIMDNNPTDTSVYQMIWLRQDSAGNIVMGAWDETGTGNIDSATIVSPPYLFFPNQYLTVGYSQTDQSGEGKTSTDSVISVPATVGSYTNCIQIRSIRKVDGIIDRVHDTYYAYQIGEVKDDGLFPTDHTYVFDLVDFVNVVCNPTSISDELGDNNEFSIFPNPASDIITLNIDNRGNSDLTLNIYNVMGTLVKSEMLRQNNNQINIEDLSNGIYIFELKSKERTENQKLIIQR